MSWSWRDLLEGEEHTVLVPGNPSITGLAFDSRHVRPGDLFFALPGLHTDGTAYLADAARRGAVAALAQSPPTTLPSGMTVAVVQDVRRTMSRLSSRFWGHPSRELTVIGVTGTDGKSTTVAFVYQLLNACGRKAGFFSTVDLDEGEGPRPNEHRQSTPEAPQIHALLRRMRTHGLEYAVLESTSHGLSPRTARLADVTYTVGLFTNLSQDHLEFHGTLENYLRDKVRLFEALDLGPEGAFGVVNRDDPHHRSFVQATRRPVLSFSTHGGEADLWARDVVEVAGGLEFTLRPWGGRARLNMPGRHNVANALAALVVVGRLTGLSWQDLVPLLEGLRPPRGRWSSVERGQPFRVVVDYAHTPGAFETVLPDLKRSTPGRLIVVFGSAGERDRSKRPLLGQLADRYADLVILTDEDPRLEDPEVILDEIQGGIVFKTLGRDLERVRPRREAIRRALSLAREGDTVALLGKGHEASIQGLQAEPWDEVAEAQRCLEELGYAGPA